MEAKITIWLSVSDEYVLTDTVSTISTMLPYMADNVKVETLVLEPDYDLMVPDADADGLPWEE